MTLRQAQRTGGLAPRAGVDDATLASRSRRFGAWSVVEHKLRAVRAFFWAMIATALGSPFLYLFAFGVGLATLVSRNDAFLEQTGVGYLQFVAPALIINAAGLAGYRRLSVAGSNLHAGTAVEVLLEDQRD